MAAPYELVPVPLTGGVDEGTDSLSVEPGSFARVENARFDKASRISKRFGFERAAAAPGGDAWGHTTVMGALGDAVVAAESVGLHEWARTSEEMVTVGVVPTTRVRRRWVHFGDPNWTSAAAQLATEGGYTVFAVADVTNGLRAWCEDDATGALVSSYTDPAAVGGYLTIATHPGRVCIAVLDGSTDDVHMIQLTLASMTWLGVTRAAFVAWTLGSVSLRGAGDAWYLAYSPGGSTLVAVDEIDTALATTTTVTLPLTWCTDGVDSGITGADLFLAWTDAGTGIVQDAVLAVPGLAVTRGGTAIAGWTGSGVRVGCSDSSPTAMLSATTGIGTAWRTRTVAGATSFTWWCSGVGAASEPFYCGGRFTQWVYQAGNPNSGTLLWLSLDTVSATPSPLGSALYGLAPPIGTRARVTARASGERVMAAIAMTETEGYSTFAPAVAQLTFTAEAVDLGPPVAVASDLMFPAGSPWLYSPSWRRGATHAQWLHVPWLAGAGAVGAGALTALGVYRYALVYEGRSPGGGLMRSIVSDTLTVTLAGAQNTVNLTLAHAGATTFRGLGASGAATLEVYRTVANATADAPFYRLSRAGDTGPAIDPTATTTYALADVTSDAFIATHPQLYITGGELDNEPIWGGASSLAVHSDRVFACGGEDPEVVWYSKTFIAGEVASFSSALQLRFAGEDCVAVASLDDVLVVFTRTAIYGVSGYGPNNTGSTQSGGYQQFLITADTGCKSARALVRVPGGIIFHGAGGLRLLTRARAIELIGQPVQDLIGDSAVVLWAITVPDVTEARFGIFDAASEQYRVVVLDYSSMRWTVHRHGYEPETAEPWSPTTLAPVAAVYSPTHGVLMAGKCLALETRDGFEDPGAGDRGAWYGLEIETPQLALSPGGQSWKRLRAVHLTGLYRDRHGLRVRISTDGGAPEDHEWTASAIAAEFAIAGQERVTVGVARQLGTWYSVVVSETYETDTVDTEGVTLRGLALHVAQRPGAGRDPLGARR